MTPNQDENHGDKPKDNPTEQAKQSKLTRQIVYATWVIASTGIILGIVQYCSYKETSHADLRAYVQVVNPREAYSKYGPLNLWVGIVNFGKTPANNVFMASAFTLWKRDSLPLDPRTLTREPSSFAIAPNETLLVPMKADSARYWRMSKESAKQGFGVVYYDDYTGASHKTVFAFQYEFASDSWRRMPNLNYGD